MVIRHRRDGETFLFCTDSNARVGSVISNSVGGVEPDEESKNGEFFHACTEMALPATFRGGGGTWQDRPGRWHRLDHVGVACDELTAVSRVEVDQEGVLAVQEREDHRPGYSLDAVVVSEAWSFHLSPLMLLGHVLQIERSCRCQRFMISLNKSGVTCRLSRHNGLRRRWSGPLRSRGRQIFGKARSIFFSRRASAPGSPAHVCAGEMESEQRL